MADVRGVGRGTPEGDSAARGATLLALALRSLEEAFRPAGARFAPVAGPGWLRRRTASFVTLRAGPQLRGCVGSILAERPLAEDVWENARAAAFRDVRFEPLEPAELPGLDLGVSVLSPLETVPQGDEGAAWAAFVPGVHGAVLEWGIYRGVFLPQVWRHLEEPEPFFAELKRKAGLPPEFWAPEARLWRFTVEEWRSPARELTVPSR